MSILTIGIPTYNRPHTLSTLIDGVTSSESFDRDLAVTIINDGGPMDVDKVLEEKKGQYPSLKVIRNKENLGYAGTFLRLFEECDTEYLMLMADDDIFLDIHMQQVFDFLDKVKPDFTSPQWLRGTKIYRGQRKTKRITPKDFVKSSRHAPGLIYKVESVKELIPVLRDRLAKNCAATETYPQVLILIAFLLSDKSCWNLALPVAKEGAALPSAIKDHKGNHYASFSSRLQQAADFDSYILEFTQSDLRDEILSQNRNTYLSRLIRTKFLKR